MKETMIQMEADVEKFVDKENNSAGTRVRKGAQELKGLIKVLRDKVTEVKEKRK
jgi:hypothetical protein